MNARSALFDLYGDHLRTRGRSAPIASLVRLLAALDVAAPAARTAVSRMVRQGGLSPVRPPPGGARAGAGARRGGAGRPARGGGWGGGGGGGAAPPRPPPPPGGRTLASAC